MAQGLGGFLGGLFGAGPQQQQLPPQAQQPGSLNADPMQGLGFLQRMQYLQQNNPQALMALGSGMMQGNMSGGFAAAGDQMAEHRKVAAEQQKVAHSQNMTKRWLMANKGMDEQQATMAMSNPAILTQVLKTGKGGDGVEYSKVPIYGTDENGNTILGTVGADGSFKKIDTGGFNVAAGVDKIDLGTRWMLRDKRTGEVVGYEPKENYQESFDKGRGAEEGKAVGEATGTVGAAQGIAGQINAQVESLKTDPYLPNMLGPIDSRLPNISTDAARVQGKIDQLRGGAFLQARQMLKGGGAITDYEGQKAEAAFARMNEAQSVGDFNAALDEFNVAVQQGLAKLQARTGVGGAGTIPPPGAGNDYKSRYGLED